MKPFIALVVFLSLSSAAFAADPAPPQCVEDKIAVQKLTQEKATLVQRLMQAEFQASQQAQEAAKTEQARLENLLPKKPGEKK